MAETIIYVQIRKVFEDFADLEPHIKDIQLNLQGF